MKKQKTKKKLSKPRSPRLAATPKFMAEESKEAVGLDALGLAPQAPLGTDTAIAVNQ